MKSYLSNIIPSIYSVSAHRTALYRWSGMGFGYLLLVIGLSWLLVGAALFYRAPDLKSQETVSSITHHIKTFLSPDRPFNLEDQINRLANIINQFPDSTITEHYLTLTEPTPLFIKDPQTNKGLVIFDTTGQYQSVLEQDAWLLLTRENMHQKFYGRGVYQEETLHYKEDIAQDMQNTLKAALSILHQFPALQFKDHILTSDQTTAINITDPVTKKTLVTIDTSTHDVDPYSLKHSLLTSDTFYYMDSQQHTIQRMPLSLVNEDNFDEAIYQTAAFLYQKSNLAIMAAWLIATALTFLTLFFITLTLAFLVNIFAKSADLLLEYDQSVRITIYAFTPAILYITACWIVYIATPYRLPVNLTMLFIILLTYLICTVFINRNPTLKNTR